MTPLSIDNRECPLVLIGGTLCNARLWQPLIERLNVSAVMCLTLTGSESAQHAAQQLLKVLPPRFLLVGFSLGAIVALQIAADAPERLAGLALLSVNPLADRPENAASRRAAVVAAREQGHDSWLSANLWHRYVAPDNIDNPALHDLIGQMARETHSDTFAGQTEIAISRRDNRDALRAPDATWITLNAAGHFFVLESVDSTAAPLRQWIMESLTCE
jgi:pimeloyl-ACP methyl ester carboxylesterase